MQHEQARLTSLDSPPTQVLQVQKEEEDRKAREEAEEEEKAAAESLRLRKEREREDRLLARERDEVGLRVQI